jgi:hypothetical protein
MVMLALPFLFSYAKFMADPSETLTEKVIEREAKFKLTAIFTDFAEHGTISPSFHDERERLAELYGEGNILPSFFLDDAGVVQLGLFMRSEETPPPPPGPPPADLGHPETRGGLGPLTR